MRKCILLLACLCLGLSCLAGAVKEKEKPPAAGVEPKYRETLEFLVRESLLKRKSPEFPGTISGGVQYGFDRTSTGWCIYLLNKSAKPAAVEVELELDKVKLVTSVRDMVDGERFAAPYVPGLSYRFKVPVQPGKYRILRITAEPFEPDYEKYYE